LTIFEELKCKTDRFGNTLTIDEISGAVALDLVEEIGKGPRNLGFIKKRNGVLHYEKPFASFQHHLFRKGVSWGFNWILISKLSESDVVRIFCNDIGAKFVISVADMIKEGNSFASTFKEKGFEVQRFVPLVHFKKYKLLEKEPILEMAFQ